VQKKYTTARRRIVSGASLLLIGSRPLAAFGNNNLIIMYGCNPVTKNLNDITSNPYDDKMNKD
jgi:hypothetical protein